MPRPPVLPLIDWKAVFASGQTYDAWIAAAESHENALAMQQALESQSLEPHAAAMLGAFSRPIHVIAIAEDWCGDVVRHVPVLERIAQAAPKVALRFITREAHKDVFARFLTNGGEAIPKFIFLNDQFVECGNWGPMPESCRRIIARGKACGQGGAAREKVSALYAADTDRQDVVRELLDLLLIASCSVP